MTKKPASKAYSDWQSVSPHEDTAYHQAWRTYSDKINLRWLQEWWPDHTVIRTLKTDLFDEAAGAGLLSWVGQRSNKIIGIDIAQSVIRQVGSGTGSTLFLRGDVRSLAFKDNSFDVIISPSTLDHFYNEQEIDFSLKELYRVLVPGGRMFLSMDNLSNPLVYLRNMLPMDRLLRWGIISYPIGISCTPKDLHRRLGKAGFTICRSTAMLHCPRSLAIFLLSRVKPETGRRMLRWLEKIECLSTFPSRYFTGYFIAVEVMRPD
jgi:ubiquinone/menaquinone biosynthesis C-methylase UbiE